MSERIDKVAAVIDLARRIAAGEMSETDSAIAILKLMHECEDEAQRLDGRRPHEPPQGGRVMLLVDELAFVASALRRTETPARIRRLWPAAG
jgi:hypothetical protein